MGLEEQVSKTEADRRAFLAAAGKFAVVTPPAMSLLLSTTMTSPAIAASGDSGNGNSRSEATNGLGNGVDDAPPGNPPENDGPGSSPGNPGNRGRGRGLSAG